MARWFLGGEMVGGEIPWWRDDRIPIQKEQKKVSEKARDTIILYVNKTAHQ